MSHRTPHVKARWVPVLVATLLLAAVMGEKALTHESAGKQRI